MPVCQEGSGCVFDFRGSKRENSSKIKDCIMLGKLLLLDRLSDFNYIYMSISPSDICSLTYSYILFDSFIQYILFDSPV